MAQYDGRKDSVRCDASVHRNSEAAEGLPSNSIDYYDPELHSSSSSVHRQRNNPAWCPK
jgi:hypothetical protein